MRIFNIIKAFFGRIIMNASPKFYARLIGVKLKKSTILLGKSNWGTEPYLITIGEKTRISKNVTFWTHDGGISVIHNLDNKYKGVLKFGLIEIGDNCFIGANTTILCNVKIGNNCIVGACSLVTKNIPDGEVWGGNPAHFICTTNDYAEKLLKKQPTDFTEKGKKKTIENFALGFKKMNNRGKIIDE